MLECCFSVLTIMQTPADSLLSQAAATDTTGFWHTLLQPSQWTLVNVIALVAGVVAIIGGAYGFWRWLRSAKSPPAPGSQNIGTVIGDVFGSGSTKIVNSGERELSTAERDAVRSRYLERLRRQCQALPLAALGGDEGSDEEITLEKVYIELLTTTRDPRNVWKPKRSMIEQIFGERNIPPLSALNAVEMTKKVVILGDPGSGKSTFVKKLAAWLAAARLDNGDPPPGIERDLLPVLVVLRDLAPRLARLQLDFLPDDQQRLTLAHAVQEQIVDDLQRYDAPDFADELCATLLDGRCLLILDGLDEVPFDQRKLVRRAVGAVLGHYPLQRLLVTCRIRSYTGDAVLPGIASHTLAPFNKEQIKNFAHAWYRAQKELGRLDAKQAEERSADLAAVARDQQLIELAENPMMLTTMAIIHQCEIGLPRERVRLFNQAVDVLLRRWHKGKFGSAAASLSPRLVTLLGDDLRLRASMEALAYKAHRGGKDQRRAADLPRGDALALLEQARYLGDAALAAEFLDYVDQRSGLLLGHGGEPGKPAIYSFPHRTFQEYLAGCFLAGQRDPARQYFTLAGEGDYWAPAVQLGAEELLYNRRNRDGVLDLAYRLGAGEPPQDERDFRAVLWSGTIAALFRRDEIEQDAESPDGGPRYLQRLLPHLCRLLDSDLPAIERADAGNVLAALGDPRPEVLQLDEMQFCYVPAGPFWMGDDDDDAAKPQHRNTHLDYPYWIARFPVTVAQYRCFAEATSHQPHDADSLRDPANRPVRCVTWHEALAFCDWLTRQWQGAGRLPADWRVRLPSEAEWEKAARGGIEIPEQPIVRTLALAALQPVCTLVTNPLPQRRYPWGDDIDSRRANYDDAKIGDTSAVGCFPRGCSPYGCEELSGNVWEWTRSLWGKKWNRPEFVYPYDPGDGREAADAPDAVGRVLRGVAFFSLADSLGAARRVRNFPGGHDGSGGFRLVLSPVTLHSENSGL